jgi:hypothetical protein
MQMRGMRSFLALQAAQQQLAAPADRKCRLLQKRLRRMRSCMALQAAQQQLAAPGDSGCRLLQKRLWLTNECLLRCLSKRLRAAEFAGFGVVWAVLLSNTGFLPGLCTKVLELSGVYYEEEGFKAICILYS